jgi:hypothetical protein
MELLKIRYLGEALAAPCPTCEGDVTPNDGVRDGTCVLGEDSGLPCDANAADATFPWPGGGQYSYDCFPSTGKNVSGPGLRLDFDLSTGIAALPPASVVCGFPPSVTLACPCGVCSHDAQEPCTGDADCAAGGGVCVRRATFDPRPNECQDGLCTDAGGGEGVCAGGPVDSFCDAALRADGEGFVSCLNNADCLEQNIGFAAGNCTLTKQRECFLDPITATGAADASDPLLAAAYCSANSANPGYNLVTGLPGPLREKLQVSSTLHCAGAGTTYPGCP